MGQTQTVLSTTNSTVFRNLTTLMSLTNGLNSTYVLHKPHNSAQKVLLCLGRLIIAGLGSVALGVYETFK
jgi:hypothetical protein